MSLNDKIASLMLFSQEGSACQRPHNGRKQFTLRHVFLNCQGCQFPRGQSAGVGILCEWTLGWAGLSGKGLEVWYLTPHTSGTPWVDGRVLAQLVQNRRSLRPEEPGPKMTISRWWSLVACPHSSLPFQSIPPCLYFPSTLIISCVTPTEGVLFETRLGSDFH